MIYGMEAAYLARICCAQDADAEGLVATNTAKGGGWMDTILNLIPGRRAAASNEPSEEAIRRTHENLRWVPKAVQLHTIHALAWQDMVSFMVVLLCN